MGSPSQAEKSELTCDGDALPRTGPVRLRVGKQVKAPTWGGGRRASQREEGGDTLCHGAAESLTLPSPHGVASGTGAFTRDPQREAITGPPGAPFVRSTGLIYLLLGRWAVSA